MTGPSTIRLYGTVTDSIVDGPGLRFSVFVQGCTHGCPGCHNPESWPFEGGTEESIDELVKRVLGNKLCTGVTLSGGDPFQQPQASAEVARRVKAAGRNVWTYTGYLYEDLLRQLEALGNSDLLPEERDRLEAVRDLLALSDVLVDGPFVQSKRSLELKYCGSSNQRLIDLAQTRAQGRVVLWEDYDVFPTKPPSW